MRALMDRNEFGKVDTDRFINAQIFFAGDGDDEGTPPSRKSTIMVAARTLSVAAWSIAVRVAHSGKDFTPYGR